MTNKIKKISIPISILALVIALTFWLNAQKSYSSAPSGLVALVSTTTVEQMGPQETKVLLGNNRRCASRIITTKETPITINFGGTASSTATSSAFISTTVGHTQPGTTTQAYDAGIYGCGYWGILAPASTTITITQTE